MIESLNFEFLVDFLRKVLGEFSYLFLEYFFPW